MSTTSTLGTGLGGAVDRCRRQQEAWARLSVVQRLRPVQALRRLLVEECDALCAAVARDLGKTSAETVGGDILPLAAACRFLLRQARSILKPRRTSWRERPAWLWGQSESVVRRPRGVVGLIGTWNYPIMLCGVPLVQALTAGNGVVWKPSEVAPASARALFALVERAGFPAGLVHLMEPTREGGRELAEADVDHIVFTGSSTTGRALAQRLGQRLISSTLELSGCDAMFVLADADVELAARAAWFGATSNRGQTCIAVRRAFVHRSRYDQFAEALRPLTTAAQPQRLALGAQAAEAHRLVEEALANGARPLGKAVRSTSDAGDACTPVVVLDARPEMAICREASFAPVMAVLPFESLDEAVRMDRQCRYALGASVFTRNAATAESLAAELRTGMVTVNDVLVTAAHPATPFGGRGASGWGVTQGAEGLLEMTVPQVVSIRGGRFRPHYKLATGAPDDLVRGFLEAGHAAGFAARWRGLKRIVRALWHGI